MLGRLEASLHDFIAEVAFLCSPKHRGKGFASEFLMPGHLADRSHRARSCGKNRAALP